MVLDRLVNEFLLVINRVRLVHRWEGEVHVRDSLDLRVLVNQAFVGLLVVQIEDFLLILEYSALCMRVDVHYDLVHVLGRLFLVRRDQFIELIQLVIDIVCIVRLRSATDRALFRVDMRVGARKTESRLLFCYIFSIALLVLVIALEGCLGDRGF